MGYPRARPGDNLKIPASAWNKTLDLIGDNDRNGEKTGGGIPKGYRNQCEVLIKNDSGDSRSRFEIMSLGAPIWTPTDSLNEFKRTLQFVADDAIAFAPFVVLQESIPNGQFGRAVIAGATPVRLNVIDEDHEYADAYTHPDYLTSVSYEGPARILYKESGTGLKWAWVLIGNQIDPPLMCEAGVNAVPVFASPITTSGRLTEASASAADNGIPLQFTNGGFWVKKAGIYHLSFKTSFRKTAAAACAVRVSWDWFAHDGTSTQGRRVSGIMDLSGNRPGLPSIYQWNGSSWVSRFTGEGTITAPSGSGSTAEVRCAFDASFATTGAPVAIEHSALMYIPAGQDVRPAIQIATNTGFGTPTTSTLVFQQFRMAINRITGVERGSALRVNTES